MSAESLRAGSAHRRVRGRGGAECSVTNEAPVWDAPSTAHGCPAPCCCSSLKTRLPDFRSSGAVRARQLAPRHVRHQGAPPTPWDPGRPARRAGRPTLGLRRSPHPWTPALGIARANGLAPLRSGPSRCGSCVRCALATLQRQLGLSSATHPCGQVVRARRTAKTVRQKGHEHSWKVAQHALSGGTAW